MNKRSRIPWLDVSRGTGLLMVVLGHIWEADNPAKCFIYAFHVPLFFIISGILLSYTGATDHPYSVPKRSKSVTLLIPYFFYEIVFLFLYGALNAFQYDNLGHHVWDGLLFNPVNTPLWFLVSAWAGELLFLALLKKGGKRFTAVIITLLYLIPLVLDCSPVASALPGQEHLAGFLAVLPSTSGLTYIGGLLLAFVLRTCLALGFLAFGYYSSDRILNCDLSPVVGGILLILCFVLSRVNGMTGINHLVLHNPVLFTLCGVIGSLGLLLFLRGCAARTPGWIEKSLSFIGTNTICILGLHIFVLRVVQRILPINTESYPGGIASLFLICMIFVPIAMVLNRWFPWLNGKKKR